MPFELWEVKRFSNNTVSFNLIKALRNSESIKNIATTSEMVKAVNKEVRVVIEEDHLNNTTEELLKIYNNIKDYILYLDSKIRIRCTLNNRNIVDILPIKKSLKVWFNCKWGSVDDSKNLIRNVSKSGHWVNGNYEITLNNNENVDYIFNLIKQVYKLKK